MIRCPLCGTVYQSQPPFCASCGSRFAPVRKTSPLVWILAGAGALTAIVAMAIVVALAMPNLNRASMNIRDQAAVAAIRTLHQAEAQYLSRNGRYAASLAELGPPSPGAAGLIDAALAGGSRDGYVFTLTGDANGYVIRARPLLFGTSGSSTFYSDQGTVIRRNQGPEAATAASPEFR